MGQLPAEIEASVEQIATLSPTARAILTTGAMHLVLENDEIDPEAIRQELFLAMVEDLSEMGLYFTCANEVVYADNWLRLQEVIDCLSWILPNGLYPKLQQYETLRRLLGGVMDGISDDPLIQVFLDTIAYFKPDLEPGATFLKQNMRATDMFTVYLENQLELIRDEQRIRVSNFSDPEWYAFRDMVVGKASDAFFGLVDAHLLTEEEQTKVARRMDISLVKDMGDIHRQDLLNYVYRADPAQMSATDKAFFDKTTYEYKVSTKLFPEYYTARQINPNYIDLIGMLVYRYAMESTVQGLKRSYDLLKTTYPDLNKAFDTIRDLLLERKASRA